jgi:hypothetical protein
MPSCYLQVSVPYFNNANPPGQQEKIIINVLQKLQRSRDLTRFFSACKDVVKSESEKEGTIKVCAPCVSCTLSTLLLRLCVALWFAPHVTCPRGLCRHLAAIHSHCPTNLRGGAVVFAVCRRVSQSILDKAKAAALKSMTSTDGATQQTPATSGPSASGRQRVTMIHLLTHMKLCKDPNTCRCARCCTSPSPLID